MSTQHAGTLFNPLLPEFREDPYPALHRLRREDPVHHSALLDTWVLTRYADVHAALRDPNLSASVKNWRGYERFFLRPGIAADNLLYEMYGRWMLQIDPPDHTRLRNLVNKAFTPAAVEHVRTQIAQTIDALLDAALASSPHFDLIAQVAYPLPLIVINQIMGIPQEDTEKVKAWSAALLPSFSPALSLDALTRVNTALAEFRDYFASLVQRRRADPGPDLLSALIQARDEGDRLDDDELHATAILLAFAGHASTVQALGNIVLHLADHPEQCDLLRQQPRLLTSAVEESLRHQSPLQLIYRTTTRPCTLGDKTIPANELLFLSLPAANRDPARFPDPDRFDVQRTDNRHLAFGYGGHFCAGAALARLELSLLTTAFLKRFRSWRPDRPLPPRDANMLFRGFRALPLSTEPAA